MNLNNLNLNEKIEDLLAALMMILMITSRMKKSKMTACRENGNRVSVA